MKLLLILTMFTFLFGCKTKETKNIIEELTNSSEIISETKKTLENNVTQNYTPIQETFIIDNNSYFIIQSDPRSDSIINLTILDDKNDTIYVHDGYATNGFELEDFDNDGILDIRLYHLTNVGGISELIMFDKTSSRFRPIVNFDNFPEPTKIKNTKYWYSYHRSGCADSNWGSELFKIEKFTAIEIGNIEGVGCDGEVENGIFAFKVNGDKKKKIFAEKRKPGYYDDKWDFIARYWLRNYKKFE